MKQKFSFLLAVVLLLSVSSAFAMSTYDFDRGMSKGISYFNREMYYEARDEFQWFCDYNWGDMNPGQQQYALDYLDGTKARIAAWERSRHNLTEDQARQAIRQYVGGYLGEWMTPGVENVLAFDGTYRVNGKDYYQFRLKGLVDNHRTTLTFYVIAIDGSDIFQGVCSNGYLDRW